MTEEFLQFIWEQRLYNSENLTLVTGEKVEILDSGMRNSNAGPDFFNARIKIGSTIWAGNIEIHKNSSDWIRHHHQSDGAYDNIILHVVETSDKAIYRACGEEIPTLVISCPMHIFANYQQLLAAQTWIPCQARFHQIDRFMLRIGYNRLMIERLQDKTGDILQHLSRNNFNWNETFYQFLSRNFGFKTNAIPFELLAKALPVSILGKHKDNLFQLEALLFGQAGLLNQELMADEYFVKLRSEYNFLAKKYGLKPGEAHLWKFLRLRPVNFPTVRIAQMAALIHKSSNLFSKLIEVETISEVHALFDVKASAYWDEHYKFSTLSKKLTKHLGDSASSNLIINTVIPFLFVYGEQNNKDFLKDRALDWLEQIPAEKNSIIKKWQDLGIEPKSAFDSQALLQLKNRYCDKKRCLNCHVGNRLIRTT